MNIIQWISMLQDLYEKFDYNDLDCQKRLICEVMREPEYFGNMAKKFKNGFQYAKYLEVLSLPDDMRELLDEYLDANSRADQQKECEEFFQCPYSIKDSVKRNFDGNSL
jgi:predicted nucleotidyltransferase